MRTVQRIRVVLTVVAWVVLLCSCVAWSQTLSVDGEGVGTVIASLSEFGFTASLEGEVEWIGEAVLGERRVWFSAEGAFRGIGVRSILSLVSEAWLACSATGSTSDGAPAAIRSLLYLKRVALIPLQAGDLVVGVHYTLLTLGDEEQAFTGGFVGTATGTLKPADTPLTIQLDGTGSVHLTGEMVEPTDELLGTVPLNHPALTPDFLDYIIALFAPHRP
jgi:hypothetical protein